MVIGVKKILKIREKNIETHPMGTVWGFVAWWFPLEDATCQEASSSRSVRGLFSLCSWPFWRETLRVTLCGCAASCGIAVSILWDNIHFKIHHHTLSTLAGSCNVRGEMLLVWGRFERGNNEPFFLAAGIFSFRPNRVAACPLADVEKDEHI